MMRREDGERSDENGGLARGIVGEERTTAVLFLSHAKSTFLEPLLHRWEGKRAQAQGARVSRAIRSCTTPDS